MGARPSSFKKGGGGFLNGVDGKIVDILFTDNAFPDAKPKAGKKAFNALHCVLTVRADGADDDVTTTLFVGSADELTPSEDGHALLPEDGRISGKSDFGIFIGTLVEAGYPEDELPEDSNDFSAIIGWRMRFEQRINEEKTKKLGKRKGKDGKGEYARTDLIVADVYGKDEDAKGAKAGKGAKASPAAAGKAGKSKAPAASDVAAERLVAYVSAAKGKTLGVDKLKMKAMTDSSFRGDPDTRDAVIKLLKDVDFLGGVDGIELDEDQENVSLA